MKISSSSNIQIPQPFLLNQTKKSSRWPEKFGQFFKNLEAMWMRKPSHFKTAVPSSPCDETTSKTQETAAQTLQLEKAGKPQAESIDFSQILPFDSKVTLKQLDNGMSYYICKNAYPSKETASLRLVIRTGSTDEAEEERGLSHFLEHLLFYETESFEKKDIKRFLESKGAEFGADQNAHTSYNETVYKFDIPLNDPELLEKALHILREMTTKAKITDSSVEEERGVVLDEILDEDAGKRYRDKRDAVLFEGTPYPHRKIVGLEKVIRECTPEQIRAYYRRTYQPQNMALVVVGDVDTNEAEKLIQKHFGDISKSSDPQIQHNFQPIQVEETRYVSHADPESTGSVLQMHYPLKMDLEVKEATVGGVFQGVINSFYQSMFNKRLQEIVSDSELPPFNLAIGGKLELMDNLFYYRLSLVAKDGELPAAYKRILLELKRMREHGFLQKELESAKKIFSASLQHLEKEKNHLTNEDLSDLYVSHFSKGNPAVDLSNILELKKKFAEMVSLEHVNAWGKMLASEKGAVVSTLLPTAIANTGSEELLKKAAAEAALERVVPYANSFVERPLLRHVPQAGKVTSETFFEKVGVTQWVLENGMRVFVRPSKQTEDKIILYASSVGGELKTPFEKRAAADMAVDLYTKSGCAGLTPSQLQKMFDGKIVSQKILFRNYTTAIYSTSSKKDLDSAFQLLHVAYTDHPYRKEVFAEIKKECLDDVKYRDNDPETLFHQMGTTLCTQKHPSFEPISAEEFEKAEFQDTVDFLNDQFQNPANYDLIISGNVDLAEAKSLVEKYMAGIPQKGQRANFDSFKYPGYEYPSGVVVKEVEAGIASPCQTHVSFPAPAHDCLKSRQLGIWIAGLVKIHLYDLFTFGKEDTYSVDCRYSLTTIPGQEKTDPSSMELAFSGIPENIRDLNGKVIAELKRLHAEGFTTEEVASYRAIIKESYRKILDDDHSWVSMLASGALWNQDLNMIVERFNQLLESFDEKVAHEYLKKLFPLERYVMTTLFPKK